MKSSAALPGELVDADERRMVILHFQKYGFAADERRVSVRSNVSPFRRIVTVSSVPASPGDVVDRRVVGIGRHL